MGEMPGFGEQKHGDAFRGRIGKLLTSILKETGFEQEEVFITNTILCRPPGEGKVTVKKPELEACRVNIEKLIKEVQPEVIVPVGVAAMKWLTGRASGITKCHGSKMDSLYGTVVPTMNPGYALKKGAQINPETKEEAMAGVRGEIVSDFEYVRMILDGTEPDHEADKDYTLIETVEQLEWVYDQVSQATEVAVDLETTGLLFFEHKIIGVAISWEEKQGVYIPLRMKNSDVRAREHIEHVAPYLERYDETREKLCLPSADTPLPKRAKKTKKKGGLVLGERMVRYWGDLHDDVVALVSKMLKRPGLDIFGWNFKFDHRFIFYEMKSGQFPIAGDGMFMSFLLDENSPNDLKSNAYKNFRDLKGYAEKLRQHVSASNIEDEQLANAPIEVVSDYACGDVDATLRLCRLYRERLQKQYPALWDYHENYFMPLHHIYAYAEFEGARVDKEWVAKAKKKLEEERHEMALELFELLEEPYDPESKLLSSPQQLVKKVFGPDSVLKIPTPPEEGKKKRYTTTTGAPSTSEVVIKELIFHKYAPGTPQNQFARRILDFKGHGKQLSTYITGCTSELDRWDRVHWNTNLIGAVTGRLSAKRIPIQTIPRKPLMRGIFIPWDDWYIIEFDYSQLELRIAAWYSQDPVMCAEFRNGEDSHTNTAISMFGKQDISKDERKLAKSTNFGSLYEGGPATLADSINGRRDLDEDLITAQQTAVFQDAWRKRYQGFVKWRKQVHKMVMQNKQVVSPLGRIRRLPNVDSDEEGDRAEALREGPNALIQGLGSDLAELALIRVMRRLWEEKLITRFRWSLHDALFFEAPQHQVIRSCEIIQEEMQRDEPRCPDLMMISDLTVFHDRWAGEKWEDWDELRAHFADKTEAPYEQQLLKVA